jgi:hypothetical protein
MDKLLLQGLSDGVGFVAGALLGMILARLFGFDPLAEGYGASSMIGILMCGLGGGLGVQLSRRFLLPFLERQFKSK